MYTMKKQWRTDALITLGIILIFLPFLYCGWKSEKHYKESCDIFCDSIEHLHGFYDAKVTSKALPMQMRGIAYTDWYITLKGVIDNEDNSRAYAKSFSGNVAVYHSGFIDSITIIYADDSTVYRKYAFANSDLFGRDNK